MTSIGKFDGVIAADDADGLLDHGAHVAVTEQATAVEHPFPVEFVDQSGPGSAASRPAASPAARPGGHRPGSRPRRPVPRAGRLLGSDRGLQLFQAPLAQRAVGRTSRCRRTRAGPRRWAASMSSAPAADVVPSTRPVAGLTLSNSSPDMAARSSPSISIRRLGALRGPAADLDAGRRLLGGFTHDVLPRSTVRFTVIYFTVTRSRCQARRPVPARLSATTCPPAPRHRSGSLDIS